MKASPSRILSVVLVAIVLLVVFWAVPYSAVQPVHIPLEMTPAEVDLAWEDFSVTPEDAPLTIQGWWMPAENARASLVFIHGGGSARHSTYFNSVPFYAALVAAGVNVAAIDLRNHGLSSDDASGMQFGASEKYDALAAIRYARERAPGLPVYAMGISMGGATVIHAAASGADIAGLILLDPLLHTADVFARGGTVQTGLPSALFLPSAWAAQQFFGLPSGEDDALALAKGLSLPVLLMQDPDDPVTRAVYARELAAANDSIALWMAPPIDSNHPDLARREGWYTHVMAYAAFPDQFLERVLLFIDES